MMNSTYLCSILFIIIIIYSPIESLSVKRDVRVRREEPEFVKTTCILINSAVKERCTLKSERHNGRYATQTQSCVVDEKFRVKYKLLNNQMITSSIETYGRDFPRLIQIGESETCYYNPENVNIVRWTHTVNTVDTEAWERSIAVGATVASILLLVGIWVWVCSSMR